MSGPDRATARRTAARIIFDILSCHNDDELVEEYDPAYQAAIKEGIKEIELRLLLASKRGNLYPPVRV